jgi:hypothetical protein
MRCNGPHNPDATSPIAPSSEPFKGKDQTGEGDRGFKSFFSSSSEPDLPTTRSSSSAAAFPSGTVVTVSEGPNHMVRPLPLRERRESQSASLGSALCIAVDRAARRLISASGTHNSSKNVPRMTKLLLAPQQSPIARVTQPPLPRDVCSMPVTGANATLMSCFLGGFSPRTRH